MRELRIETAEYVLPGHPDKPCDAAVDAIVDAVRLGPGLASGDPAGQCGLEAASIFGTMHITGRIASGPYNLIGLDIPKLVQEAYRSAGYMWGPYPAEIEVSTRLCQGEFAEGEREARHLSDDQAICIGYANALAKTNHLPPAHWLARRIGRAMFDLRAEKGAGEIGPDGKVLVTVESDGRRQRPVGQEAGCRRLWADHTHWWRRMVRQGSP